MRFLIPLIVFIVLVVFLWVGLGLNPREVPSPFINKPAPDFTLQQLHEPQKQFSNKDMLGKVWMLNVWASWCVACRQEHPLLVQMSRAGLVPLYGLNYKDNRTDAELWLREGGNPYVLNAADVKGDVGINYGVYGVPESFIIDKRGIIRHKVIGPVTPSILENCLVPLIRELQNASGGAKLSEEVKKACA
jgi:cytochrome c biogenesis protein CcmG/thiol:disulfide interchange protein DsbE